MSPTTLTSSATTAAPIISTRSSRRRWARPTSGSEPAPRSPITSWLATRRNAALLSSYEAKRPSCRARRDRTRSRGDAGDRFHRDAGLAAGRNLVVGRRIAALKPAHAPARLGEPDDQAVALVMCAGCAASLADQHLPRLAPRELQDFRRHPIVVQDDVGGLQRADRAQGQEL